MKKIIALLFALIMAFSLTACGSCDECGGEKKTVCAECNGAGEFECTNSECEGGFAGFGCTNCGGREGVSVCTECGGDEKKVDQCTACHGYGLICNFCSANEPNYPNEELYPYAAECDICEGKGQIECAACLGEGKIPCHICLPEEYNEYSLALKEKQKEAKYQEAYELYENGDYKAALDIFKSLGDYEESKIYADRIQEEIDNANLSADKLERISGKWTFVSGSPNFFVPEVNEPFANYYTLDLKKNGTYVYLEICSYTENGAAQLGMQEITWAEGNFMCSMGINLTVMENGNLKFENGDMQLEIKQAE